MRADIGIALDGDADRVMIVDERGHVVDGDQLLAVIAESWKQDGRLATSRRGVDGDVEPWPRALSRRVGHRAGADAGRRPLRARADARSTATISAANRRATLSCRIIRRPATALSRRCRCSRWSSAATGRCPKSATASSRCRRSSRNVRYQTGKPMESAAVRSAIASAEKKLGRRGRLIVRPSGTEPVIRVMGEGDDRSLVECSCRRRGRGAERSGCLIPLRAFSGN